MTRSEYEWIPNDPMTVGSAEAGPTGTSRSAGVLWVPDPEQRRGWREVYVDKPGGNAGRVVGFRKPGAR